MAVLARGSALCTVIAWALSLLWWPGTGHLLGTEAHSTFLYFLFFFPFAHIPPSSTAACCSAAVPLRCAGDPGDVQSGQSSTPPHPRCAVAVGGAAAKCGRSCSASTGCPCHSCCPFSPRALWAQALLTAMRDPPGRSPPAVPGLLMVLSSVLPPCQDPHSPTSPCPSLGHI